MRQPGVYTPYEMQNWPSSKEFAPGIYRSARPLNYLYLQRIARNESRSGPYPTTREKVVRNVGASFHYITSGAW